MLRSELQRVTQSLLPNPLATRWGEIAATVLPMPPTGGSGVQFFCRNGNSGSYAHRVCSAQVEPRRFSGERPNQHARPAVWRVLTCA